VVGAEWVVDVVDVVGAEWVVDVVDGVGAEWVVDDPVVGREVGFWPKWPFSRRQI